MSKILRHYPYRRTCRANTNRVVALHQFYSLLQYFCFSWGWYFYITWLPTYLKEARGLDLAKSAVLAGFPLFFGGLGSLMGGVVANRLAGLIGDLGRARRAISRCASR